MFGEDDHFFSRFAAMTRSSPVLPLIGGGTPKFQPVFVGDMTAGLLELLKRSDTTAKTYEFGGPLVYSFKGLMELLSIRTKSDIVSAHQHCSSEFNHQPVGIEYLAKGGFGKVA